jgi:hypothetical protein
LLRVCAVERCACVHRWVIIHPASTKRTAALLRVDAVEWFAGVSLALNFAQLGAVLAFVITSGRFGFSPAGIAAALARAPLRALAAPMFGLGLVFKVTIFSAIGRDGVYYGSKFGKEIPWVHGFPFSVTGALPFRGAVCAQQLQRARAARCAKIGRVGCDAQRSRCFVPSAADDCGLCSAPAVPGQLAVHHRRRHRALRRGAPGPHAAARVVGHALRADWPRRGGVVPQLRAVCGAPRGR